VLRSYGVPRSVRTAYLREAVELTAILCHRVRDPRRYLLAILERRSKAYWRAVMALEEDPDSTGGATEEDGEGGPSDP